MRHALQSSSGMSFDVRWFSTQLEVGTDHHAPRAPERTSQDESELVVEGVRITLPDESLPWREDKGVRVGEKEMVALRG